MTYPGKTHVRNSEIQKAKNRTLDRSVGIVTRLRTGLPKIRGSTPGKGSRYLLRSVQTVSGTHPSSYSLDTSSSVPKASFTRAGFRPPGADRTAEGTTGNFNNIYGSNRPVEQPRTLRPSSRACTVVCKES
jgi:hypothetical protein